MRRPAETPNLQFCDCGSTAVEFALAAMALFALCLGILEFGRGLNLRNQLSQAIDYAARELLLSPQLSDAILARDLRTAFKAGDPTLLGTAFATEVVNGSTYKVITLTYPLTLLIPGLANSSITLSVSRRTPVT